MKNFLCSTVICTIAQHDAHNSSECCDCRNFTNSHLKVQERWQAVSAASRWICKSQLRRRQLVQSLVSYGTRVTTGGEHVAWAAQRIPTDFAPPGTQLHLATHRGPSWNTLRTLPACRPTPDPKLKSNIFNSKVRPFCGVTSEATESVAYGTESNSSRLSDAYQVVSCIHTA